LTVRLRGWLKWAGFLSTFIFLLIFIYFVDFERALELFRKLSARYIVLALIIYFVGFLLRALRFSWLLGRFHESGFTTRALLPVALIHNFFARIIPFRAGEASYIVLMKVIYDLPTDAAVASLLLVRIYDLVAVLALFTTSAIIIFHNTSLAFVISVAAILWLLTILTVTRLPQIFGLTAKLLVILDRAGNKSTPFLMKLRDGLLQTGSRLEVSNDIGTSLRLFALSVLIWLTIYAMFFVLMWGFGAIPPSVTGYLQVMAGSTLSIAASFLPINVLSGPMEVGWTLGFVYLGMSAETALVTGLGINMLSHLATAVFALPALYSFIWKRRTLAPFKHMR